MFQPAAFREDRIEVMHDLMIAHPFATLVSSGSGGLTADHVPLVLHTDAGGLGVLRGHVAVANPLFGTSDAPQEVLAVFQGPHSYVTPSWYASKAEHGKVVPTWNYVAGHARGVLRFRRDAAWVRRHLEDLTAQHEGRRPAPWAVSDAPEDFIARQMRGLVGFEIALHDVQGKWKVSQNRPASDRVGVAAGLGDTGDAAAGEIAAWVRARGLE